MSAQDQAASQSGNVRRRDIATARRALEQNRRDGADLHTSPKVGKNSDQKTANGSRRPGRLKLKLPKKLKSKLAANANRPDAQTQKRTHEEGVAHSETMDPDIWTVEDVAKRLRMSVDSVRRIDFSLLPHTGRAGVGRHTLYMRENVLRYIRQLTNAEIEARNANLNSQALENQIDTVADDVRGRSSEGSTP